MRFMKEFKPDEYIFYIDEGGNIVMGHYGYDAGFFHRVWTKNYIVVQDENIFKNKNEAIDALIARLNDMRDFE